MERPQLNAPRSDLPIIDDELDLLDELLPLDGLRIVELGCGNAHLLRDLLQRHPRCEALALDAYFEGA